MTNEQLTAYLQDDSYLYAISYEELKTLVMQYPYATNLRILLLKKSFLEQNKDYDRNLQMAATFTTNRKYLYQVVQKVKAFQSAPQSVILGEDYLELTELSNIEKLLAEKQVSDALGTHTQFDALAADWQLEFGNLDATDETNPPKIKGRDAEEDEMFDLVYTAQIVDNQSIESDEDLNFLIDNIVSEFSTPSVKTDLEANKLDFEIVDTTLETSVNAEEEPLDLAHFFREELIDASQKVVDFSDLFPKEILTSATAITSVTDEIKEEDKEYNAKDDLMRYSFESINQEEDDLMAHSFAILNGDIPDTSNDDFMYSFIDEKELIDNSIIENELDIKSELIDNELINDSALNLEFEFHDNDLTYGNELNVKSELIDNELVNNNELNIKSELIDNEFANDKGLNIKSKLIDSRLVNNNELNIKSELIDNELIHDKGLNAKSELIDNELIHDNELNAKSELINDELVSDNELNAKSELIDDELINNDSIINLDELSKQPFRIVRHEAAKEIAAHSFPIIPVIEKKAETAKNVSIENIFFEQNTLNLVAEEAPQYANNFEGVTPVFEETQDDTTEIMAARKSDLELEILNENKVTIATKPIIELPSEKLSFTEWLRQFRMNEAAAKGQTVAKTAPIEPSKTEAITLEELDNQSFIEREDNRKTIKQSLDAIFEIEDEVPEDLFGLLDGKGKKTTKKDADTEGYEKLIAQHLTAEIEGNEPVFGEKKKKKKKKEMHELAARSIEEDGEMVSETLADLLVWQGKNTKAIEMYLKLSLTFPDKSGYFAAKIETIKKDAA